METNPNSVETTVSLTELEAEQKLEQLLDDPDNNFLTAIAANKNKLDNADSAVDALQLALDLINKRQRATFKVEFAKEEKGIRTTLVDYSGLLRNIRVIKEHARSIGEGGDAFVVISESELEDDITEICYKFSKAEETKRGRNTMDLELEYQGSVYEIVQDYPDIRIGIPQPYYFTAMGNDKIIAMEKLPARSVDDLLRGFGSLPKWVTDEVVDEFCDDLKKAVDVMHSHNFYHRDLHEGNIMFTQEPDQTKVVKLGYIIDFGVSGYGLEGMDPYKKETSTGVFTYNDDYGIIEKVRRALKELINRRS